MLKQLAAAVVLVATPVFASPADDARQMIDDGLTFLAAAQQDDGTWQPVEQVPPAITALVLRGMVETYGIDDPRVVAGYDALVAQQVADGGIYDDLLANYNTAIAISALAAANDDGRYDAEIERAIAYIRRLQWIPGTDPEYAGDKPGEEQQVVDEDDPFYGGFGYGGRSRGAGRPDLSNMQMALQALHDAGIGPDDPVYQRAVVFITRAQNNSETNPAEWAGDDGG
ncbi:MAG: hypothetical protein AAF743_12555, partial [Planctomycetota bacterium]